MIQDELLCGISATSKTWLKALCPLFFFADASVLQAQSINEVASEASAREFYDDVQQRLSRGIRDGPSYYLRGYEMTPEIEAANKAQERDEEIAASLRADPEFMRHFNGFWQHYQARSTAKPGEFCAATYVNLNGSVTLSGVDSNWEGGLLMFVGKNIPQPEQFAVITAMLTQNNDPSATVRIFNLPASAEMPDVGTLIFAVPSMKAALSGMENDQQFVISIENQEVFRMTWKDGKKARNELRRCILDR